MTKIYSSTPTGTIRFDGSSWIPVGAEPMKCNIIDHYESRAERGWWTVEFDDMNGQYAKVLKNWLNENDLINWFIDDTVFEFKNKEDAMMFYLAFK